jgi:hypothetical protein
VGWFFLPRGYLDADLGRIPVVDKTQKAKIVLKILASRAGVKPATTISK